MAKAKVQEEHTHDDHDHEVAEAVEKSNFFKDYFQQIIVGVSITAILAVITFGVTQIGKIDGLERTIRELPNSETTNLKSLTDDLQESAAKSKGRMAKVMLMLKAKGVFTDAEVSLILSDD